MHLIKKPSFVISVFVKLIFDILALGTRMLSGYWLPLTISIHIPTI